ncbi:MAG: ATPase, T2SS/T4P/T4SS family [Planctomycetota bacterium]|jgi:type II secretory ATPase GspE/PulE/Tfp pilus assembly ATPase PilB-like protein
MMAESQEKHVAFWKTLTDALGRGVPLLKCLEKAKAEFAGTEFETASASLIEDLLAGKDFSRAMEGHASLFSRSLRAMVRAGEASGQLDKVMARIVEGLEDGSFRVPGTERPQSPPDGESDTPTAADTARLFRVFGRSLSSGVNIVETLDIISEEAGTSTLSEAMQAVRRAIMDGRPVAGAMREFPDLFADRIVDAVRWGERAGKLDSVVTQIADGLEAGDLSSLPSERERASGAGPQEIGKAEDVAPVVKLVNLILSEAIKAGATDIHIEPFPDRTRVRYRIDGECAEKLSPPRNMHNAVLSRIKIMAKLDIVERRTPQDGKFQIKMGDKTIDTRVSVLPTVHGESVTIRMLRPDRALRGLGEFGLADDVVGKLRELTRRNAGVIIVAGPSGSGKSTLLYAMLKEIDSEKECVVTVEDPVEFCLDGVAQIHVNTKAGVTFPHALRAMLRHDPDVLLVGELRDLETAQIAFRAAITGHLVFTVMHTGTSPETVTRLVDMGIEPFLINGSLAAAISQRLVRKLCDGCKVEAEVSEERMPKEAVEFIRSRDGKVFAPAGCDECSGTGYRGRLAIHEILIPDENFRKALARSPNVPSVKSAALHAGMKTMFESGMELVLKGFTSIDEVYRVAW